MSAASIPKIIQGGMGVQVLIVIWRTISYVLHLECNAAFT